MEIDYNINSLQNILPIQGYFKKLFAILYRMLYRKERKSKLMESLQLYSLTHSELVHKISRNFILFKILI